MKFYKQSATESFAGNTSVERFIYFLDIENKKNSELPFKSERENVSAGAAEELSTELEAVRLAKIQELGDKALTRATSADNSLKDVKTDFRITENSKGEKQVVATLDTYFGDRDIVLVSARDIKVGVTAEDLLAELQNRENEFLALNEDSDSGVIVSTAAAADLDLPGGEEGQNQAEEPEEPAELEARERDENELQVDMQAIVDKNGDNAGQQIAQLRLDWGTEKNQGIVIEGAKITIEAKPPHFEETIDISTYEKFTDYFFPGNGDEEVVDEPAAAPEVVAASETNAEKAIDKLNKLTGKALQTEINAQAKALGIKLTGAGTENGFLKVDGSVGKGTIAAKNKVIEALKAKLPIEGDNYLSSVNELSNPSADDVIKAIKGNQVRVRLLQRDLRNLGLYKGGIDGVPAGGTKKALEDGLKKHGNIKALEAAARVAEVVKEGRSHGRKNPAVDALMAKIKKGEKISAADVKFTGKETGGGADRTREILDFVEQASADKKIDGKEAGRIIELMLAEDKYDGKLPQKKVINKTLHEGSGGFIIGLSRVNPETRVREVSQKLTSRIRGKASREVLAQDMLKSKETLDLGTDKGNVTIDGRTFDMATLRKIYILTGKGQTAQGKGALELPMGDLTSSLKLHNLVYRDGALVGTMGNGCEGNLVIIPVDRQYVKYVKPKPKLKSKPRRVVKRTPKNRRKQRKSDAETERGNTEWLCESGYNGYERKYVNGIRTAERRKSNRCKKEIEGGGGNGGNNGGGNNGASGKGGGSDSAGL